MRIADTSFLYAFFNRNDRHHEEAVKSMRDPEPIDIPHGILQEMLDLMRYRQNKDAARKAHDYLLGLPHVEVLTLEHGPALAGVWQEHKKLSYADAQGVQAAMMSGGALLTFDKDQLKALS